MFDHTLYDSTAQTEGSLALAHQKILRAKIAGVFVNITGDANNIAGVPTKVAVKRENYGNKGSDAEQKLGDNWVITFDVEAVRDNNGAIAQSWLVYLLNVAKAKLQGNLNDFQLFDALDGQLGAIQGSFSVAVGDLTTGYADKGGYKFTLTSSGVVEDIASPIAGTGEPIIESIPTAAGKTVGDLLVLKGYKFDGTVSITVDTQPVLKFTVLDSNTITLLIPATVTGSAAVVVTNEVGASNSVNYAAA